MEKDAILRYQFRHWIYRRIIERWANVSKDANGKHRHRRWLIVFRLRYHLVGRAREWHGKKCTSNINSGHSVRKYAGVTVEFKTVHYGGSWFIITGFYYLQNKCGQTITAKTGRRRTNWQAEQFRMPREEKSCIYNEMSSFCLNGDNILRLVAANNENNWRLPGVSKFCYVKD